MKDPDTVREIFVQALTEEMAYNREHPNDLSQGAINAIKEIAWRVGLDQETVVAEAQQAARDFKVPVSWTW